MKTNKLMGLLVLVVAVLLTASFVLGAVTSFDVLDDTVEEDSGLTQYDLLDEDFITFEEGDVLTFDLVLESNESVIDCVLNADGHTLDCTTVADQSGESIITVSVDDGVDLIEDTFTITVTAVNDEPTITAIANQEVFEGFEFELIVEADDIDNEAEELSIKMDESTVDGVSFTETTWLTVTGFTLSGTPEDESHDFSIVVTDGEDPSAAETFTLTIVPFFKIDLDINDDGNSGELIIGSGNEIIVEVENMYDETLEDVEVTIEIDDLDVDESEEIDNDELRSGRSEDVYFEFSIDAEDVDETEYEMIITIEGKDEHGENFVTVETRTIDMDIERHKVIITKVAADSSYLQCGEELTLQVTVENIGRNDEDEVEIRIINTDLGIDERKTDIELDDFSGRDNDYRATFQMDLDEETLSGDYVLEVSVYLDDDLQESEDYTITVESCNIHSVETEDGLVITDEFIQELREQLEAELAAKMAGEETLEPVKTTEDFRGSDTYVALLAILMVLLLVGVLLGLVALIVKRK